MRHDSGIHPDTLQNRGPFWLWTVSLWGCLWLTKGRALFWSLLFDNIRGCRGCRRSSLGNSLQLPWRTQIIHDHTESCQIEWLRMAAQIAQQTRQGFQPPFLLWVQTLLLLTSVIPNQSCDTCGTFVRRQLELTWSPNSRAKKPQSRRAKATACTMALQRSAEIRALSNLQIIEGINEIRFLCGLPFPAGWVWSPMTLTSSKLCMILLLRSASFTSFSPEVPVYLATPLRKVWYICEPWRSVPEARTTWAWWHDDDMMIVDDRVHHGAEPATSHRSPSRAPATTKIIKRSQSSKCWEVQMAKMIWNGLKRHM